MGKTVKEWETDFQKLDNKQQQEIVAGITALAQWPLFKEQYRELGLFDLAAHLWHIAYGEHPKQYFLDLLLKK